MKKNTFESYKKIMMGFFLMILVVIFFVLLILTMDDKFVKNIKEFVKSDTKVLYISDKKNYDSFPINLLDKYEINYMYINSSKLSKFQKRKIQRIVNNKDLSNIIVVYESGNIKDAILSYENDNKLVEFLTKNNIIPTIQGDITGIMNKVQKATEEESLILYLPYEYSDDVKYQENLLSDIAKEYNIEYSKIDAYLLSNTQKQKINSILQISDVEDQIVLFIKNSKVVGSIRGYNRRSEYINKLIEYNYIETFYNRFNEITYDEFMKKADSDDKNLTLIIKDDCKYCNEVINILNQLCDSYDFNIDYINIGSIDSKTSTNIEIKLKDMGYSDGFSTPLLIITEKGKVLDYSIGLSSLDFYKDMFKEYGLIK